MKSIAILSGKGGVGKSSITASLAIALSEKNKIILADCDVDAPNLALVFGKRKKDFLEWKRISTNQKAVFDLKKCNSCKKCFENCYFGAVEWKEEKPVLKKFGCEGCGVAELICPMGAIKLKDVENAGIGYVLTDYGFRIVTSQLDAGESGSGKLVAEVKNKVKNLACEAEIVLIDSAAGTGCPVIASVSGSDYCILVVEPTPTSLYDVGKALDVIRHFNIPSGIILNKFDLNPGYVKKIENFAKREKLKIISRIPYDKIFTEALVEVVPVWEKDRRIKEIFEKAAAFLIKCKNY